MKTTIAILAVLILAGCGSKTIPMPEPPPKNIQYVEPVVISDKIEGALERGFQKSDVPWDAMTLNNIRDYRAAIKMNGEYLKSRLVNGELPAHEYIAGMAQTVYLYSKLNEELKRRVSVPGAVEEDTRIIYEMAADRVITALNAQQAAIAAGAGTDNGATTAEALLKFKEIFALMKPFLSMKTGGASSVLGGLL